MITKIRRKERVTKHKEKGSYPKGNNKEEETEFQTNHFKYVQRGSSEEPLRGPTGTAITGRPLEYALRLELFAKLIIFFAAWILRDIIIIHNHQYYLYL